MIIIVNVIPKLQLHTEPCASIASSLVRYALATNQLILSYILFSIKIIDGLIENIF